MLFSRDLARSHYLVDICKLHTAARHGLQHERKFLGSMLGPHSKSSGASNAFVHNAGDIASPGLDIRGGGAGAFAICLGKDALPQGNGATHLVKAFFHQVLHLCAEAAPGFHQRCRARHHAQGTLLAVRPHCRSAGVAVVFSARHESGPGRFSRDVVVFGDGQRVYVGAKLHHLGASTPFAVHQRDHASCSNAVGFHRRYTPRATLPCAVRCDAF